VASRGGLSTGSYIEADGCRDPALGLGPILSRLLCPLRHEAVGTSLCGASHSWPSWHPVEVIGHAAAVVENWEPLLAAGALAWSFWGTVPLT
jgi:hypothetical protein